MPLGSLSWQRPGRAKAEYMDKLGGTGHPRADRDFGIGERVAIAIGEPRQGAGAFAASDRNGNTPERGNRPIRHPPLVGGDCSHRAQMRRIRLARACRALARTLFVDVVALILDLLTAVEGSVSVAAGRASTSRPDWLLLCCDEKLLVQANQIRRQCGLKPLGGRGG